MPRRGNIAKRDVLPDPVYNDKVVTKLVNQVMLDGKKSIAQGIVYEAFKTVWFTENKPFGFEIHDLRLGVLKMRLEQLRIRVKDYLSGKIDKIEELEAPVLPFADFNGYVSEFHVALLSASSVDGR